MTGRMAGQTINDRFLAAKHSIAGQGLAKSVCKATTEEMIGPKKKHLDYLVHCTNEPNVSIPQLANLLIERSQNANWIVVYKALVTVHHMMCYGNERFTQYLASTNSTFQLSNFLDKSGVQGYDMSPFIRRYARYLNEKAISYRTVAFDFCKAKRGKDDGVLRTMNTDKLLKTLPVLQNQLDGLLEFDCSANDLTNGIINMSFMLLFKDIIRLFACYNDGIINLLEKFFDMNKKQCKEALDIYKKFLVRMDRVAEFLKVAENVGIDKGEIPDLTKAPSSLLDALEQHLMYLESKKNSTAGQASSTNSNSSSNQKNVKSAVTALSTTSNAFGNASRFDDVNGIDESLKLQVLAEEEAAMNQFKSKVQSPSSVNNPFLSNSSSSNTMSSTPQSSTAMDLFGTDPVSSQPVMPSSKASEDLLQLSNPFVDAFAPQPQPCQPEPVLGVPVYPQPQSGNTWMATNGNGFISPPVSPPVVSNGAFVPESAFASVFGNNDNTSSAFDPLGGVLQPVSLNGKKLSNINIPSNNNITNNNINNSNQQQPSGSALTGDLESSLASLAENLTINRSTVPVKGVQWNSPKNGSKSVSNWTPQPMSATTGAGYKPMNPAMPTPTSPFTVTMQAPVFPQMPQMQPMMAMRPLVGVGNATMLPSMTSMGSMGGIPTTGNPMGAQQMPLFH